MREIRAVLEQKLLHIKKLQDEIEILNAAASLLSNEGDSRDRFGLYDDAPSNKRSESNGKASLMSKNNNEDRVVTKFP